MKITKKAHNIDKQRTEPTLNKLHTGDQIPDDQIDFEWPTKEDLMNMEDGNETKLKSISVTYLNDNDQCPIQKVLITLSNEEKSPLFEAKPNPDAPVGEIGEAILDFNAETQYTQCEESSDEKGISGLRFIESTGEQNLTWKQWEGADQKWKGPKDIPED